MEPYRLYYHESVWDFLRQLGKNDQQIVLAICREMATNPFLEPDYVEPDGSGHSWCCILRNNWAVVYYADHAVREMKIGKIRRADS